jgi:DNA-binding GntR family transcriptional regulator
MKNRESRIENMMRSLTLAENLVQFLRVGIITGELRPGQKINEMALASSLEVSSAPLREAFRVLENEHLIESVARKGRCVSKVSLQDCHELYQTRMMMESFAVDLLESRNIRDLSQADSSLALTQNLRMPTGPDPNGRFEYVKAVFDFHFKLVESAGNTQLIRLYNSIFSKLARYQYMYMYAYDPEIVSNYTEEHKQILDLIRNGNYSRVKEVLGAHIAKFVQLIDERIKQMEQGNATPEKLPELQKGNEARIFSWPLK